MQYFISFNKIYNFLLFIALTIFIVEIITHCCCFFYTYKYSVLDLKYQEN